MTSLLSPEKLFIYRYKVHVRDENVSQISGVYVTRPSGKEPIENVWKVEIISNRSWKVIG